MNSNGRLLLYLDILGFTELVRRESADKVYEVIGNALSPFIREENRSGLFKTIYFSDTFLFYQRFTGYDSKVFTDMCSLSSTLLSELLAKEIPARGSIVCGQFEVGDDSQSPHQIYFGKALIEAYKAEQREQWLGIAIQPSAWLHYEEDLEGITDDLEREQFWMKRNSVCQLHEQVDTGNIDTLEQQNLLEKRNNKIILLNPFLALLDWYQADKTGETDKLPLYESKYTNGILGFQYLLREASKYADNGEFSTRDAVKYHATVAFLRKIMGNDMFEWAIEVAALFEGGSNPGNE